MTFALTGLGGKKPGIAVIPGQSENLVAHRGFEPLISALRGRCPRPLDECATTTTENTTFASCPSASGRQPDKQPAARCPIVAQPVVETIRPPLPELEHGGRHTIAAPVGGPGDRFGAV